jgi:hypothetical protein
MNKTTLTAVAAFAVTGVALVTYKYHQIHFKIILDRFPNLDPKVVKEAYKEFMKNAAVNKYGDMSNFSDEKMDRLFLDIVRKQTASK